MKERTKRILRRVGISSIAVIPTLIATLVAADYRKQNIELRDKFSTYTQLVRECNKLKEDINNLDSRTARNSTDFYKRFGMRFGVTYGSTEQGHREFEEWVKKRQRLNDLEGKMSHIEAGINPRYER